MMKRFIIFLGLLFLSSPAMSQVTTHGDLAAFTLFGGGGTNSGASSTVETDEFTGAATYSLKIPTPPARGSITPNLVLNYHSQRRNPNSWVGYGWEMDIGSVVRVTGDVGIDYLAGTNFEVRLAGQSESLTLITRNIDTAPYGVTLLSGQVADLYQTKIESSFTFYLHIHQDPTRGNNDFGWISIDKSGTRYFFGQLPISREAADTTEADESNGISRWMLERIEDSNRNNLSVSYDASKKQTQIIYQDITITFLSVLERDEANALRYFPVFREPASNRSQLTRTLQSISILQGSRVLQRFYLTYDISSRRGVRQLRSIQQSSATDGTYLPPLSFEYFGEEGMSFVPTPTTRRASRDGETGFTSDGLTFADMDGDGLVDQVIATADGFHVYFNNGNDFIFDPGRSNWLDPFMESVGYDDPRWRGRLNSSREGHQWLFLMDMNGDGLPDRFGRVLVPGSPIQTANFRIAFNNGHGWDVPVEWRDPYVGDWAGTTDEDRGLIDMNGDGLPDRVVGDHDGRQFFVYYNTGAGFKRTSTVWRDPYAAAYVFDAVGKISASDIYGTYVFIRDMNGDGLPDRVFQGTFTDAAGMRRGGGFVVALNKNGVAWGQPGLYPRGVSSLPDVMVNGYDTLGINDPFSDDHVVGYLNSHYDFIDMNGDGFLDRVQGDSGSCSFRVFFYKGMSNNDQFSQLSAPITLSDPVRNAREYPDWAINSLCGRIHSDTYNQDVFLQDFNGDGLPDRMALFMDFWRFGGSGYNVYKFSPLQFNAINFSDTPSWWQDSQVNQPMGALKAIHDGQGSDMAVEYFPSARPLESGFANHRFLPFNMNLVHKIYTQDYTLATSPGFSSIPEAGRHPGMRWISYLFQGGNFFFRKATNSVTIGMTDATLTRTRFARFNGFQKVTKIPLRGPGETWRNYSTTTYFHQALGDTDPLPDDLRSSFDSRGYNHYAFSGKPYFQIVSEADGGDIRQEMTWSVNALSTRGPAGETTTSNFDCQSIVGSTPICFPRQTEVRKIVSEVATRISRVTYDHDTTNGNKTGERHYDRSGNLLLSVMTNYIPESEFRTLRIRDRPRLQTKFGPAGEILRKKEFGYDARGNPVRESLFVNTDGSQRLTTTREFNTQGNMTRLTDADGVVKTIGYDSAGLFPTSETVTTPGGRPLTTNRTFDRLTGEVSEERGPQGVGKRIVRDGFGRPLEEYILSSAGTPTRIRQNSYAYMSTNVRGPSETILHVTTQESQPDYSEPLQTESYSDSSGQVLQKCVQSERGNYRRIQYRVRNGGREEAQTEPVFAENCNLLPFADSGRLYRKRKDLMGRDTFVQPPPGDSDSPVGTVTLSYATNSEGQLVKTITNSRGQTTIEAYDAQERLISVRDPAGTVTQYTYNPVGDLLQVNGASRVLTTIAYDLLGRKTEMTDADMGRWQYRYDALGRLERQIDARNQSTRFTYDALGRTLRKENHLADDSLERQEIYDYDTGSGGYDVRPGELFQVEEKDGSGRTLRRTRFDYESDYRRTRRLSRQIPGVGEFHQTLNHDYLGRVRDTTYPGGRTLSYRYMRNGNLMQICNGPCEPSETYYSIDPSNAFDVFGNLQREFYGNGVVSDYSYFPNSHRLQNKRIFQGSNNYLQRTYTYDETSNLTNITDPLNLQGTGAIRSASYDNLDRLTGYTFQDGRTSSLRFDNRGNILQNSESFGTNTYQYTSPKPHAVTQIGDQRFEYDDNGNMISDPSRRMFYNTSNQLSRVEMQNGNIVHYDYDYTGARVSKRAVTRDPYRRTTTTNTHYLGDALEIKGDQITLNIFAGSRKVATRSIGAVSGLTGTGGGTLINNGIDPEMNLTMAMPYLFVFFVLFLLGSLRPVSPWSPLLGWICHRERRPSGRSVAISLNIKCLREIATSSASVGLLAMTRFWLSWCRTFQETLRHYPKHAFSKSFLLFMILLFQLQPMSLLFADEGEPRFPTSDSDYFYYVHDDHLGSSALLTEGKPTARHSGIIYNRGELLQRFEYAPFGKETFVLNPNLQFDPSYTGQKYDVETGLYFYKSRYYNPILGRFIQPDTVVPDAKNLQAYNRYTYVNNNPLKYVDPSGHFSIKKLLGAFAAAIAAIIVFIALLPAGPLGALGFLQLLGPAMAAGMAAGVIGGAISGGLTGALRGMALGGISGAAGLVFSMAGPPGIMVMAGLGLGLSANAEGWEGLVQFGASLVGAYVGSRIGMSIQAAKGNSLREMKAYPASGNKPRFDFGRPLIGQRMQARLGPDTSELVAAGGGLDVGSGVGGGAIWGGRTSASEAIVFDSGSSGFYNVRTTSFGQSQFDFGGSAGAGIDAAFYTGNITQFAGTANTLNVTIGTFSLTVTPGSQGGSYFTFSIAGRGTGFEVSVSPTTTIVTPVFQ